MAVRFGNVLGSRGSVIPLFKRQIERGGPVKITHPEINRFFMSIPEAAQLVLQAGAMGEGGELFILKMGDPVKIKDLAYRMIEFSGLIPEVDIQIEYTGLRPGEKLYEELITDVEGIATTSHEKIMVVNKQAPANPELLKQVNHLRENIYQLSKDGIRGVLKELVPWFALSPGSLDTSSSKTSPLGLPNRKQLASRPSPPQRGDWFK
jgi:FlaA1/EpsC-like NDP-sugar epimerase